MRYSELMRDKKTGTAGTIAGMKKTRRTFLGRGLAVILVAYGLVMSFLIMRWSGSTSVTEQATNLATKKSTKK